MALEDITKKILEDARAEADVEISRAEAEVVRIEEETKALERVYLADEKRMLEEKKSSKKRERIAAYRQSAKKNVDAKKRILLDLVFEKASDSLASLSEESRRVSLDQMIETVREDVKEGEMLVASRDENILKEILVSKNITLLVRVSNDVSDGCIIKAGGCEYDFRFSEVLCSKKRELEPKAARMLFEMRDVKI
jgi:vacuolar-type H+-ATPase subunit E/Vma4